jgi:hypothetical protein
MIPVTFVVKLTDRTFAYPCLNPYEADARAAAMSASTGEMYTADPGRMDAGFAPRQAAYGPFRYGEVCA